MRTFTRSTTGKGFQPLWKDAALPHDFRVEIAPLEVVFVEMRPHEKKGSIAALKRTRNRITSSPGRVSLSPFPTNSAIGPQATPLVVG